MDGRLSISSQNIDVEAVECPACKGTGRCIQCEGHGKIPFRLAQEIKKRVDEERESIRQEGLSAGLDQGRREIETKNEKIKSLQDELNRSDEEKERIRRDAMEAGRVEERRQSKELAESQRDRLEQLQRDYASLEDTLAAEKIAIRESKKLLEDANKTVQKLQDQLKQTEVNRTPQEYGLLKEEVLVDFLTREFPEDQIIRTPGSHKGDVIQQVNYQSAVVGTILYERKETGSFEKAWIDKLNKNRLERQADSAILITKTMKKDDEPVRLYPNLVIMMPSKDVVSNIVAYVRWQIITARSTVDDSKRLEMKVQVDRCVDSYRRQWTAMQNAARTLKKTFEEMHDATVEGMEGITQIAKMLKLPTPNRLQELPYRADLLPS